MYKNQLLLRRLKLLTALSLVTLLALVGWFIYYKGTFHVVHTEPNLSNVSTVSPFLEIYFNKTLTNQTLSISSTGSAVSSYGINGKMINLDLNTLIAGKKYVINITLVKDSKDDVLKNLKLVFTPTYLPFSSLSSEQQKTILQKQTAAANHNVVVYIGTNALVNNGLTTTQVLNFEQDVKDYANSIKLNLSSATINQDSVEPGPLNQTGVFTLNFSLTINGSQYTATVSYSNLTDIRLQLYSSNNSLVYDSFSP